MEKGGGKRDEVRNAQAKNSRNGHPVFAKGKAGFLLRIADNGERFPCRMLRPPHLLLLLFVCLAFEASAAESSPRLLRHAREVLALTNAEAVQSIPVQVTGVVIAADSTWASKFFVQDETGGVFVSDNQQLQPKLGEIVEVKGVSGPGKFAPIIGNPHWRVIGSGPLPPAKIVSMERVASGVEDGQRVEFAGIVRTVRRGGNRLRLDLASEGHRFTAEVDHPGELTPEKLLAARIRFPAVVAASQFKANSRQLVGITLFATSGEEVSIEQPEAVDPFTTRLLPLSEIGEFRRESDPSQRLHVRGTVSFVAPGVIYLLDETGGLEVRTENVASLKPGDMIDAAGFSEVINFLPLLNDATVRSSSEPRNALRPKLAIPADLARGLHHADYVRVSGRLLERSWKPGADAAREITLVMQSEGAHFTAEFTSNLLPDEIPELAIGGVLELSGISLASASATGNFDGFHLLVPSLSEVRVLQKPSPLTRERLLVGLCVALSILLVTALWSVALIRRNLRLAAHVREKKAIMSERARLALDLHDTLQQALYGVRLQLDAAREYMPVDTSKALHHVKRAGHFVEQSDAELRRTLWKLRSAALENFDLVEALTRAARSLGDGCGLVIETQTHGKPVSLPSQVEENVLRIGQEALTNVVKHAHATRVQVTMTFVDGAMNLDIKDNGFGFEVIPAGLENNGHFGLAAMRERTTRIGGNLLIESAPKQGTRIHLEVPIGQIPEKRQLDEGAAIQEPLDVGS